VVPQGLSTAAADRGVPATLEYLRGGHDCTAIRVCRGSSKLGRAELMKLRAGPFTAAERRELGGKGIASWAARLTGKRAVRDLVHATTGEDVAPAAIEIVGHRFGVCHSPRKCATGHPLVAVLPGRVDSALRGIGYSVGVSLSHDRGTVVAVAFLAPSVVAAEGRGT
jgi:hypothetical protein